MGGGGGGGGGYSDAVSALIVSLWKASRELLPVLTNRAIRTKLRWNVYNMCVRKVLFYGTKTWSVVAKDVQQLATADSGMIRRICGMSLKDRISMAGLLLRLPVSYINEMLRWNRLRFHWHLLRMDDNARPRKANMYYVDDRKPRGRLPKRLCDVICADMKSLNPSNQGSSNEQWAEEL